MKNFIKEYLNIIACCILGFIFILSSFYFVMNYYHYDELKGRIYVGENDGKLVNYRNTVDEIKVNLDNFRTKKSTNESYKRLYQILSTCHLVMTGPDLYYKTEMNRYYDPHDVYVLGGNFQSEVLNKCWALNLSSINNEKNNEIIKNVAPFVNNEVNTIIKQTTTALEEIQSNSSYFYTTKISSMTIRNYLSVDYNTITDSYQQFADLVLDLSKLINGGSND